MLPLSEVLRWTASLGIFYGLIPAWIAVSGPWLARWFPFLPQMSLPIPLRVALTILGLFGAALAALSMGKLLVDGRGHPFDLTGREHLSRPRSELVTTGVYAWSQNPMGAGDILLYAGVAAAFDSLASLAVNVPAYTAAVCLNHLLNERPRLRREFGEAHRAYSARTPLLFPGPLHLSRRLRSRAPRRDRRD